MKKNHRIRQRKDFVRIATSGFYFRADFLVVQCDINGLEVFRAGFTASKKVGNAVVRNRCKRRMRAVASFVLQKIGLPGVDYVFIARKTTFDVNWDTLVETANQAVVFLNNKISKCKKSYSC